MGQSYACCTDESQTAELVAAADVLADPALIFDDPATPKALAVDNHGFSTSSASKARKTQEQLEAEMESLLDDMESAVTSFSVQYRQYRTTSAPRRSRVGFTSADENLHKAILQFRRVDQLDRTNRPSKTGEENGELLDMYLGKKKKRLKSLPDIVRKVMAEVRIARLLNQWGRKSRRASFIKGSFEAEAAELRIDTWDGVNPFEVDTKFQEPLTMVFYAIWLNSNLQHVFKVGKNELLDMLRAIESGYTAANPFHSRVHAAEVTLMSFQCFAVLSGMQKWESYFSEIDLMVLIFAAAIHDIGHPAVNNDFMVKTKSDMALRYHDSAVLENFHLATAFELMKQKGVSMLEHKLPSPPVNSLRRRVIDIVLGTDMAVHKNHIEKMSSEMEKAKTDQDIDKRTLEKYLMHMADIGHALRPVEQHQEWTRRVSQEFYTQGDREKELGLVPLALFDREKAPPLGKSQYGFLKFVVEPLWIPFSGLLEEEAKPGDDFLQENIQVWKAMADEEEAEEQKKRKESESWNSNMYKTLKQTLAASKSTLASTLGEPSTRNPTPSSSKQDRKKAWIPGCFSPKDKKT
eukprot:TRINITY_DN108506_c0_g1_i1.p1 TRINITY_DN108506_c0_g1~~TRINITY_DN108506_c0_g1_i1.p1  ORF type:complete len:577 (+),score=130.06 TRINITY_DN108506_c0_g1_i1:90-1820(+)